MITHITIEGYKTLRQVDIQLRPVNILVGGNGAGKSNFLTFFELLRALYEGNLQRYVALHGGVDKILHHGRKVSSNLQARLSFVEGEQAYGFKLEAGQDGLMVTEETEGTRKRHPYLPEAMVGIPPVDQTDKSSPGFYLSSIAKYHFHDVGDNSPFTKASHVRNDRYFLYSEGQNIAAFIYHIQQHHPKHYQRIIAIIQSIAPFFRDFFLPVNNGGYISLQWRSVYSDAIYGVNDLSDGTLRFIALTLLFMQPEPPNTIIIDEPELGLHPVAIAKLAGMIESAAARGTQVIAATQSVALLDFFRPEDILTVDLVEGATTLRRLRQSDLEYWLEDYSLGDLWQRSIISSGQPF